MKYVEAEKRILEADKLLRGDTTSREKFDAARKLIKGYNPKLDTLLAKTSTLLIELERIHKQKVIDLTVEKLPEKTKEQKKRKKLLLLFIKSFKDLRSEVKRLKKELKQSQENTSVAADVSMGVRIARKAKGPMGMATIAAGVVVIAGILLMKANAVEVTVVNDGCADIDPNLPVSVKLPGLVLPKDPIPRGDSSKFTIPGIKVGVDMNDQKTDVTLAGQMVQFGAVKPSVDVVFDGTSLVGQNQVIDLREKKVHQLLLRCF